MIGTGLHNNLYYFQNIEDFLKYLRAWEKDAKAKKYSFMPDSTCYGLKITLQAAKEICEFLVNKKGFNYLMTARLNQDNLEVCNFR